jgi:hypothetical protein
MSQVIIAGDTSGTITLQAPAVSGSTTITLPAATGTMMVSGNMPAFSAYLSANQTITSNVNTKIAFDTEQFDTNSCYNTTNYRFTPNVAGYYFINLNFWTGSATPVVSRYNGKIYKNGSEFFRINDLLTGYGTVGGCLMYLNGTTDYVEAYANLTTTGSAIIEGANQNINVFQGYMVRSA